MDGGVVGEEEVGRGVLWREEGDGEYEQQMNIVHVSSTLV